MRNLRPAADPAVRERGLLSSKPKREPEKAVLHRKSCNRSKKLWRVPPLPGSAKHVCKRIGEINRQAENVFYSFCLPSLYASAAIHIPRTGGNLIVFAGFGGRRGTKASPLLDETAPQEYNNFAIKAAEWPQAARHEESPGTAGQDAS